MSTRGDELIPTRQSLLVRLKDADDHKSWQDFLNTYGPFIYGVAVKSGLTMVEAQEVVQETVISVSKKMPEFTYDPKVGAFKGWLMRLTHWRIKDQLRKRLRDAAVIHSAETSTATTLIDRLPDPHGNRTGTGLGRGMADARSRHGAVARETQSQPEAVPDF